MWRHLFTASAVLYFGMVLPCTIDDETLEAHWVLFHVAYLLVIHFIITAYDTSRRSHVLALFAFIFAITVRFTMTKTADNSVFVPFLEVVAAWIVVSVYDKTFPLLEERRRHTKHQ